jgi:hypothetical protein
MIEVKIQEVRPPLQSYPKLMETKSGLVVLFGTHEEGVVICSGTTTYEVGHHESGWVMGGFANCNRAITLQNKPE